MLCQVSCSSWLLPLVLCLTLLSIRLQPTLSQSESLPLSLQGAIEYYLHLLSTEPPLNTSFIDPAAHLYPFSNPTVAQGAADPSARYVNTSSGRLHGQEIVGTGVSVFVGIPYALAPVGSLRWKPAQAMPVDAAQQSVNATVLAAWCPQLGPLQLTSAVAASQYYLVGDEDCLAINIWTPANLIDPAAVQPMLPVLVFVHGGAFVTLSGSMTDYDGLSWTSASRDFILVTFDYRLGILGFFPSPELDAELSSDAAAGVSGNQGFQDQQMALHWVQDNIAAFGGDKGNVTIFGQSAGGLFICWHLISPQSQGLYHAAIIQSGFSCDAQPSPTSHETSTALGVEFAATINCTQFAGADRLVCLRSLPAQDVIVVAALTGSLTHWQVSLNGYDVPNPLEAFESGQFARVPVMIGSNHDEYALLFRLLAAPFNYSSAAAYNSFIDNSTYGNAHLSAEFQLSNYNDDILSATILFQTEEVYTCSSGRVANFIAQHSTSVYLYSFNHVPLDGIYKIIPASAFHTAELAFLFQNTPASYGLITGLTASERNLSIAMRQWWLNFAMTGDPNSASSTFVHWPSYDSSSDLAFMIDLEQLVEPWLTEYPNCVDFNQVTPQNYAKLSGLTVVCQGDTCAASTAATVSGDPAFVSFHGVEYQVHGLPNEVFNVLSSSTLQVNALFSFLSAADERWTTQQIESHRSTVLPKLPYTHGYSHPGTYLTVIAIKLGRHFQLQLTSGSYAVGIASVQVNGTAVDALNWSDGVYAVKYSDHHTVLVHHPLLSFRVVNSDGFFNIEAATLHQAEAYQQLDGLLGQSADPTFQAEGSSWQTHLVVDYMVQDRGNVFSDAFVANRFQ